MTTKKEKYIQQLKPYLPAGFEELVADLLLTHPVRFSITNPRATKLGDYRPPAPGESKHRISVNGDLNAYHFLITTLHEFAHLRVFEKHRNSVKPHGEEWKTTFRNLIWEAMQLNHFPKDLEIALMKSIANTKASSCTDTQLSRALKHYDKNKQNVLVLEDIPKNTIFVLQGKTFIKGELRRTRYLCTEVPSKRQFLIHALANIQLEENDNKK
ncbi:MAG TPA: sprT domain-containing protein [Fluviicola sp.]|nr:sprT domain-containing protein [Fluviicola sp.]